MGVAGQSVKGRTKVEVARMIQAIKVWYCKRHIRKIYKYNVEASVA